VASVQAVQHSAGLVSIFCMDSVASVMQGYVARPRGDKTFTLDDGTGGIVVSPSVLDNWLLEAPEKLTLSLCVSD